MAIKAITQPEGGTVVDAVSWILENCTVSRIDIAAAYITSGGLRELIRALDAGVGAAWPMIQKRWITSFDYLRTEPVALETILDLPNSQLKIHDPKVLDRRGCMPTVPFHPKSFKNLRLAHEANDETLERIYIGRCFRNDTERLEKLFEMYHQKTRRTEAARPEAQLALLRLEA